MSRRFTPVALGLALVVVAGCTPFAGRTAVRPSPTTGDEVAVPSVAPPSLPPSAAAGCDPSNRDAANMDHLISPGGGADDIAVIGETVYISLLSVGRIVALPRNGTLTTVASGLSAPEGIAPAPGGDLYVVEQGKNRIDRVSGDGHGRVTPLKSFPDPGGRLGIDSIHLLDSGNLLVPNSPAGELDEFDPMTGGTRVIAQGLGRPVDAILIAPNTYAVADEQRGLLQVSAGTGGAGQSDAIVTRLADLAIPDDLEADGHGGIYVTTLGSKAVYRYRNGTATPLARGFGDPQGLALQSDGSLLVVDSNRGAVLVLGANCIL